MRCLYVPILGLALLAGSAACHAQGAAPGQPPSVTPKDCAHPAPPVDLSTHILCNAAALTRLAQEIDEIARALRPVLLPDERERFDRDQIAWQAGNAKACQTDGEAATNAELEPAARDCLRARLENRAPAIRRILAVARTTTMRECEATVHAVRRLVPKENGALSNARVARYASTRDALRHLAHAHGFATLDERADVEDGMRRAIAVDGQAAVVARTRAALADCDRREAAWQARPVPATAKAGDVGGVKGSSAPAVDPLAAALPSPVRAFCGGAAGDRDALDRCLTRVAIAHYEGRIAETDLRATTVAVAPSRPYQEAGAHWRRYRDGHCAWLGAHLAEDERDQHQRRCLLHHTARRDAELRDGLAGRDRQATPRPAGVPVPSADRPVRAAAVAR